MPTMPTYLREIGCLPGVLHVCYTAYELCESHQEQS